MQVGFTTVRGAQVSHLRFDFKYGENHNQEIKTKQHKTKTRGCSKLNT